MCNIQIHYVYVRNCNDFICIQCILCVHIQSSPLPTPKRVYIIKKLRKQFQNRTSILFNNKPSLLFFLTRVRERRGNC